MKTKKPQEIGAFCGLDGTRTFCQNSLFFRASQRVIFWRHRIAHLLTKFNFFNIKNDGF